MKYRLFGMLLGVCIIAACGSLSSSDDTSARSARATCPPPPLTPTPDPAWLAYPPSGSTSVPVSIGELIEEGSSSIIISANGSNVPAGTPTVAPSPFPTPFATAPPGYSYFGPYMAVPLPTLSPNTTYKVADQYTGWDNNPPQCSTTVTQDVGTFTTAH